MRSMILIALLLIVGQVSASEQVISVQHDSHRGVTCWITPTGGISCLPDSSLPQTPISGTSHENEAARAYLTNTDGLNEQLPTTLLPQDERVRL